LESVLSFVSVLLLSDPNNVLMSTEYYPRIIYNLILYF